MNKFLKRRLTAKVRAKMEIFIEISKQHGYPDEWIECHLVHKTVDECYELALSMERLSDKINYQKFLQARWL